MVTDSPVVSFSQVQNFDELRNKKNLISFDIVLFEITLCTNCIVMYFDAGCVMY